MSVVGAWKLVLFEHWIKKKLVENELKFSKRLNQFDSNRQLLILNKDFTFIVQSTNKIFSLNSIYQGKFILENNCLILISEESDIEEFELMHVTNRILTLEQKFKLPFEIPNKRDSRSHFFKFGFVKIVDSKTFIPNQSTLKTNPFR
jgi:hypothetical protein